MSNHNYPRRLLDDAIDRAVQELVCGDPRPGLRRRVLEALNAPSARRSWIPWGLVPAGTVAVVLTVAALLRPAPSLSPERPSGSMAQAPAATTPAVATERPPAVAAEPLPARKATRRSAPVAVVFGPPKDRVSATSVSDAPKSVSVGEGAGDGARLRSDIVSSIVPIAVVPITVRPIEIKEIK